MRIAISAASEEKAEAQSCKIEFRVKTDGSLQKMLDLFKGDKKGTLVFDPEGDFNGGQLTPALGVITGLDLEYDIKTGDKNDKESMSSVTITVQPKEFDSNKDVNKRLDRYMARIVLMLKTLGDIGNGGHSFGIYFYPENKQGNVEEFGWDGDGSDYLFLDDLKDEIAKMEKSDD